MKKIHKSIVVVFSLILILLGMVSTTFAKVLPNNIIINTSESTIDKVRYEAYYLMASRIIPEGNGDVAYCMEIDKDYPSGEKFTMLDSSPYDIDKLLSLGYPNLTANELGVSNDDEAYFATQIAIWCYLEGEDANEITGENQGIINAIKYIYNGTLQGLNGRNNYDYKTYYSNDYLQDILILFKKEKINVEHVIVEDNNKK